MLIRHSILYFLGRIIPGTVSLLTLSLYTRLLTADQYGHYALVIAAVGIVNAVCFQWLSLSLARFLPAHESQPQALLSTALTGFLLLVAITGVLGGTVAWLWPDKTLRWFIILVVIIAWAQAWLDLNLRIVNVRLSPIRYGVVTSIKAILALSVGAALFYMGLGVVGILLGLIIGLVLATFLVGKHSLGLSVRQYKVQLLKDFIAYGAPLTFTFMLILVVDVSDRFFLGLFMNLKAVGAYAAAYDLTQQSLGMLMGVVNLAAFPLAVRALEERGIEEARIQLRENAFVLLAISVPATIGLVVLAANIAAVMLGPEFRAQANEIITLIALATFIGLFKSYYLDVSFQLGRNLRAQVKVMLLSAATNLILNLLLIPNYGILGAAWATIGAFAIGLLASWYLGRKVFPMPFPKGLEKVVVAALAMAAGLWPTLNWRGLLPLALQVAIGVAVYISVFFALTSRQDLPTLFSRKGKPNYD